MKKTLNKNSKNIKVDGHKGTWYVVEVVEYDFKTYYLVEHETYGDEAEWLALLPDGTKFLDGIHNGADDLIYYIEECLEVLESC